MLFVGRNCDMHVFVSCQIATYVNRLDNEEDNQLYATVTVY
jgi:hypothetical protein